MNVHTPVSCDPLEQRAALELARALTSLTGVRWGARKGPAASGKCIVLGSAGRPEIDNIAQAAGIEADLDWAGREGYAVAAVQDGGRNVLLIAANTPQGALYGAFRVASLAGARFYLSRESARQGLCAEAFLREDEPWPEFRLAERPRFAERGALPWFNFLSGPTAWDREDWAVYVDNLARSRGNLVGFHVYTGGLERYYPYVEPFIRVEADGVLPEAELDTTGTARWGYRPLSTSRFAAGSSLLYAEPVFGSEAAVPRGDLRSRYERAQELLAWVMKRAKSWGIKSFLGFEAGIVPPEVHSLIHPAARLPGGELDPFHPDAERIFHRTLEHIAATYPDLDTLWLFQHEHVLYSRIQPTGRAAFEAYCDRHRDAFPELPDEARWKGPWLLAWVESAWKWKERYLPRLKIAVSGWGGGSQFPKLIPGLDRTMPEGVAIAALLPGQGSGTLPEELAGVSGRERIAVPWWEGDAQLWHPQPRVESLLRQQDEFAARGIDGSVGLHWRTQDIEANAWAFFESCWESRPHVERSAASCYRDYAAYGLGLAQGASRLLSIPAAAFGAPGRPSSSSGFGGTGLSDAPGAAGVSGATGATCASDAALEAADLLFRMERDRWFQGAHSPVYFGYTSEWGRLREDQRSVIAAGLARFLRLAKGLPSRPSPAFDHLVHSLQFVLHLDAWSKAIGEAESALAAGDCQSALRSLVEAPAREALSALSARVMTQGDRGALASVNQRVWLTHSGLLARAAEGLDGAYVNDSAGDFAAGARTGSPSAAEPWGTSFRGNGDWAVALPTRVFWNACDDDHLTWRVYACSLDAAAAFVVVDDGNGKRRFAMEHAGPGAFRLVLPVSALAGSASGILRTRVEVLYFGSTHPTLPKGGDQTIAFSRAATG